MQTASPILFCAVSYWRVFLCWVVEQQELCPLRTTVAKLRQNVPACGQTNLVFELLHPVGAGLAHGMRFGRQERHKGWLGK